MLILINKKDSYADVVVMKMLSGNDVVDCVRMMMLIVLPEDFVSEKKNSD